MPDLASYLTDPVGFARGVLALRLYDWQQAVLFDLDAPGAVALRSCNGSGKTSVIGASACLWHASVFPGSLCVVTSGTFRQVSAQLFPAIHRHASKFPGGTFNECDVQLANGSKIFGFSTDEGGRFEGWHCANLLVVVDEAKTVGDAIFESIARCQPHRTLLLSSPGGPTGEFYRAFHERRRFYKTHAVPASLCPHISAEWIAEQTEKYGADSPLVCYMIHAEFMTAGEGGEVIPLAFLERLLADPPDFQDGDVQAGCDFAAGGDCNALAIRRGNSVCIAACWQEPDTAKAIGKFILLFREHGLEPGQIVADEGGLGTVFCDALSEAGWPVRRFNFGGAASDPEHYANAGAELWYTARRQIERREVILPRDNELISQLSTRRGWPTSKGKLELESKADLRGRGIDSPDKADALLLALSRSEAPVIAAAIPRGRTAREIAFGGHADPSDWDHPFRSRGRGAMGLL